MKKTKIFSYGIKKNPAIMEFLRRDFEIVKENPEQVLGWGYKKASEKARNYALNNNLPYVAVEDGFLCSLDLRLNNSAPLSLIYDDLGIYYALDKPSRLEKLILETPKNLEDAQKALDLIKKYRLSKYNHAADYQAETKDFVLVIDQTFNDAAVIYAKADENTFKEMLNTAIAENPNSEIWVKTHPDIKTGRKKSYFADLNNPKVKLITENYSPLSLLEKAKKVYCVSSQMGFEALMLEKTVISFGAAWYSGWSLTDDRHEFIKDLVKNPQRRQQKTLLELFYAAYFLYCHYQNPYGEGRGDIFQVIDYLQLMREKNEFLRGSFYTVGLSFWKRNLLKPFFNFPSCSITFLSRQNFLTKTDFLPNSRLLLWGLGKAEYWERAENLGLKVWQMEDGFIRSVGLGSNLVGANSLVLDDLGIYFDASKPSRLEKILNEAEFSAKDLSEARALRDFLIKEKINKYNVGVGGISPKPKDKKIILVVGQVEDDASIRTGGFAIKKNLDLLKLVRERNPEAFIAYKIHPDVLSGNRIGAIPTEIATKYADLILAEESISECIADCEELHTISSLAGFEALLFNKKVFCYGLPFYANWGLTTDEIINPRRNKKRSLEELIAAVLIKYPLYISLKNQKITSGLNLALELRQAKKLTQTKPIKQNFVLKQLNKLKYLWKIWKLRL